MQIDVTAEERDLLCASITVDRRDALERFRDADTNNDCDKRILYARRLVALEQLYLKILFAS